jgi:uncharacterized protein YidB (DUF937 family)
VVRLLDRLREAGGPEQVTALLRRDPAAHVSLDDPDGVASLLDSLREAGADEQVTVLLLRDPAAHASVENPDGVASLLDSLREAGAAADTARSGARAVEQGSVAVGGRGTRAGRAALRDHNSNRGVIRNVW